MQAKAPTIESKDTCYFNFTEILLLIVAILLTGKAGAMAPGQVNIFISAPKRNAWANLYFPGFLFSVLAIVGLCQHPSAAISASASFGPQLPGW